MPAGIVPQLGRRGRPPRSRRRVFAVPVEFDHAAERQLAQESVCLRNQLLRRAGVRMLKRENVQEPATVCITFHSPLVRRVHLLLLSYLWEHTETRAHWGVARWSPAILVPIFSPSMRGLFVITYHVEVTLRAPISQTDWNMRLTPGMHRSGSTPNTSDGPVNKNYPLQRVTPSPPPTSFYYWRSSFARFLHCFREGLAPSRLAWRVPRGRER